MARPASRATHLAADPRGNVRPTFDLTSDDLALLDVLPPTQVPVSRPARVRALLAARYAARTVPRATPPGERPETVSLHFKVPRPLLATFDAERVLAASPPPSRGAFLRAILDTYKKDSRDA